MINEEDRERLFSEEYEWITFRSFYITRHKLKAWYRELSDRDQSIYRLYILSKAMVKPFFRDCVLEWLRDDMDDEAFDHVYENSGGKYS